MQSCRVDYYLSIRTANLLKWHGFDLTQPGPELKELVDSDAWQGVHGLGPKGRNELSQALILAQQQAHKSIAAAIELLEENGYTVSPPPS
ncbi:hypothetical protein [Vreelandella aquamarina]|uniref:Uncharacterized protein n=1 Tax=Vreelandella aquamarina TaxID=77097 RepID=A0A6F8SUG5_9GAMM|nr:hypothetical protein [Halomonas meridiana]BCA91901.1 hypothetical protein HMSLTHF_16760 [Halomonas meridiana]